MSLVYLTHHNENVADYEKVGYVPTPIKKLKYTSKHKERITKQINQPYKKRANDGYLLICDAGKHERRTMGCATTPLDPPQCYLRKNQGLRWKRLHDHKCPERRGLPPIPRVSELPPKPTCALGEKLPAKTPTLHQVSRESPPTTQIVIEVPTGNVVTPAGPFQQAEPVCDPCATFRKQEESLKAVPCQNACKKIEQPIQSVGPCMTKAQQPCRTRGGFEKPKSNDPCKRSNFIKLNIKRVKEAIPKRPPLRYADTPRGTTHNLINSGLLPQSICGRNFGKVPCYINEHKKMLKEYKEVCATDMLTSKDCDEFVKNQGVRKMTIDERVALLAGLKANYTEQLKVFQTLSLYCDTPTKRLRKGRLEKDLDQLEMDIKFIQDNTDIYISDF